MGLSMEVACLHSVLAYPSFMIATIITKRLHTFTLVLKLELARELAKVVLASLHQHPF